MDAKEFTNLLADHLTGMGGTDVHHPPFPLEQIAYGECDAEHHTIAIQLGEQVFAIFVGELPPNYFKED